MKNACLILLLAGVLITLAGCGTTGVSSSYSSDETPVTKFAPPPPDFQPKYVAIIEFKDKTPSNPIKGQVGSIAVDQLTTLAFGTGRFKIIERERIDALIAEQGLAGKGLVEGETAVKIGKMLGAQYIFLGSVTNWEVKEVKTGTFVLIGGTRKQNLHIELAVDGRIIDASTGVIVAAGSGEISRDEYVSSTAILGMAPNGYLRLEQSVAGKQMRMALDDMLKEMIPQVDKEFSK
jgi:curli biogenesis system outer membrane secretion channel CsgG